MKRFTHETMLTKKRLNGDIGEEIAVSYLIKQGHRIIARNYQKYLGEIDIVSCEKGIIHFNEVKTAIFNRKTVSHETFIRPEDHMTTKKIRNLEKVISIFLEEKGLSFQKYTLNLLAVYIFKRVILKESRKTAVLDYKIYHIKDIY